MPIFDLQDTNEDVMPQRGELGVDQFLRLEEQRWAVDMSDIRLRNENDLLARDQIWVDTPCRDDKATQVNLGDCLWRRLKLGAGWSQDPLS
jgi:hypothetical protein